MSIQSNTLLIIDPQNDFCDISKENSSAGIAATLPIPGAVSDMKRIAAFVHNQGHRLDSLHVTLDSHNPWDIAHPSFWLSQANEHPSLFTEITHQDVLRGVWRTTKPNDMQHALRYTEHVEGEKSRKHIIWPEHCLTGSWGHQVHEVLQTELLNWSRDNRAAVQYVMKGQNPLTEHYSAMEAEMILSSDPKTGFNSELFRQIRYHSNIIICGEALSHCVAATVRDIAHCLPSEHISHLVLLTDCTSAVPGFERQAQEFIDEMVARGMRLSTSTTLFKDEA